MLESFTLTQLQPLQQRLAPLKSKWGLIKSYATQTSQGYPLAAKVGILVVFLMGLWMVSSLIKPKRLEEELGLPVISGSRTLEKDFVAVIERGRQMVSGSTSAPTVPTQPAAQICFHTNRLSVVPR